MNVFNDGCDEAFEHKLKTEHETFCKVVNNAIRKCNDDDAAEAAIIGAFVDACSKLVPDAQLDIVSCHGRSYRVACSNCGASMIVGVNVPFEDFCASKPFCVKCGAKLKKGIEMCKVTLTD